MTKRQTYGSSAWYPGDNSRQLAEYSPPSFLRMIVSIREILLLSGRFTRISH